MNVLDENIRRDQGLQLRRWRVPFRFLIEEIAPSGTKDPEIIPLLHRRTGVAFFTHDQDFFRHDLVHSAYAWFGWTCSTATQRNSSAASSGILASTPLPNAWAWSPGSMRPGFNSGRKVSDKPSRQSGSRKVSTIGKGSQLPAANPCSTCDMN